ncbi:MAG: TRAP transporter small permease [Desulfomicrobium sp.]|nr:TRAP transporter small permease [Desulfomicrobium sp.]
MIAKKMLFILDNVEKYICQAMLAFFVLVLFAQISLRALFDIVLPWSEEISRFSFVWFVFFGASYAARLSAHNRVTIQFKMLPKSVGNFAQFFSDIIWIIFNIVMVFESIKVIKSMQQFAYNSPALGWSMAYVYCIFPISFTLMSIRIIQVNYIKFILKEDIRNVDQVNPDDFKQLTD